MVDYKDLRIDDEEELNKFTGEWVLLFGGEIINHSNNVEEILQDAEKYPGDEVTLKRVPARKFSTRIEFQG